jgi:hypothetical protein
MDSRRYLPVFNARPAGIKECPTGRYGLFTFSASFLSPRYALMINPGFVLRGICARAGYVKEPSHLNIYKEERRDTL